MVTTLDIKVGQLFWIPDDQTDEPVVAEFAKELRDGRFAFKREGTDRETYIDGEDFERMLCDGRAKRVRIDPRGVPIEQIEIDPVCFLDPEEPGISRDERDERLKKSAILKKKQTLRFYALRYDDEPRPTKGRKGLARIIKKHLHDALAEGYDWQPSPSSLLRAIEDCGSPGDRPLTAFSSPTQSKLGSGAGQRRSLTRPLARSKPIGTTAPSPLEMRSHSSSRKRSRLRASTMFRCSRRR